MREEAVGIARVSSKDQEDGYSLQSQDKLINTYSGNQNMRLIKVFKIAETASKAKQRRIFREAMKFVADHNVKNLVVEKVDRHARNFHDVVETDEWLQADETRKIHFIKDSLVLHKNSRSQEWLNWGIRVVMAKNYIDNLREETMKGWAEKLAQGWMPGVPSPGYVNRVVDGRRIQVLMTIHGVLSKKCLSFTCSLDRMAKRLQKRWHCAVFILARGAHMLQVMSTIC